MSASVLLLVSAVPLLLSFTAWTKLARSWLGLATLLALLPAFTALVLPSGTELWLAKGHLSVVWLLDDLGKVFLLFTALGWALAAVYAANYLKKHPRNTMFWVLFLLSMGGNLLLVTAGDALTYYSGFAIMGFAAWGLVALEATPQAIRASRVYLATVVLGELLVLPGLVKGVLAAESTRLTSIQAAWGTDAASWLAVGLLLVGFGIKAGMAPFHFWLPLAHPAAPTPASAVLSGCMIKAGLLGWLRLLPTDGPMLSYLAIIFAVLGFINLLGGGLLGVLQTTPKAALAYSSLQATGTLMLMLAALYWTPALQDVALPLIATYAFFHAVHKVSLFLAVGVVPGLRPGGGLATLLLSLVSLSYIGLPGLAGDRLKTAAKLLWDTLPTDLIAPWTWALDLGTLLTFLLIARVVWFLRPTQTAKKASAGLAWVLSAVAAVSFIFLPRAPALDWPPSGRTLLVLVIAAVLALALARFAGRVHVALPPGDLGLLLERISIRGFSRLGDWSEALERRMGSSAAALAVLGLLILLLVFAL